MVGVTVCVEYGVYPRQAGAKSLLPEVRARVDDNALGVPTESD
jgi:hypothetical protein